MLPFGFVKGSENRRNRLPVVRSRTPQGSSPRGARGCRHRGMRHAFLHRAWVSRLVAPLATHIAFDLPHKSLCESSHPQSAVLAELSAEADDRVIPADYPSPATGVCRVG